MNDYKRYVGVLVKVGDKCLLCKRNKMGSFPGMWSVPAGKIEEGEETRNPDNLKFTGMLPRFTRDGKHFKGLMYLYEYNSDTELIPDLENAEDGEEHTECGYFTKKQVKKLETGEKLNKLLMNIL
jgi:NUDIX domain